MLSNGIGDNMYPMDSWSSHCARLDMRRCDSLSSKYIDEMLRGETDTPEADTFESINEINEFIKKYE